MILMYVYGLKREPNRRKKAAAGRGDASSRSALFEQSIDRIVTPWRSGGLLFVNAPL